MIKKLFSFIFCMVPAGAIAAPVELYPQETTMPTSEGISIILPETPPYPNVDPAYNYQNGLIINSGDTSAVITNSPTNGKITKSLIVNIPSPNTTTYAINVAGGLVVGNATPPNTGWLYISPETQAGPAGTGFSIESAGHMKFGSYLQVLTDNSLTINGSTDDGTTKNNLTLGSGTIGTNTGIGIDNTGTLVLSNINAFTTTGTIRNNASATSLNVNATSITSGAIENMGGTMDITATGDIDLATNNGTITSFEGAGHTKISGNNLTSGDIQNGGTTMNITLTGNLQVKKLTGVTSSTGNLQNKSQNLMQIETDGGITVDGAILNTGNSSTMKIEGASLTINGGTGANNASFINDGNLDIAITGTTKLANGFDVNNMLVNNTFKLKSGGLVDTGNWANNNPFLNKLNNFSVELTTDTLNLGTAGIVNTNAGTGYDPANMNITAPSISAGFVKNDGQNLNITAQTGTVNITGNVTGNSGTTKIIAKNTATTGAVTNKADTTINGEGGTTIASIQNNGGTLNVYSRNDTTGTVTGNVNITGTTVNDSGNGGTLNINALQLTMGDMTNTSGTTNIQYSNNVNNARTMGQVTASGGVININALNGAVTATNLWIKKDTTGGGSVNIGPATTSFATTDTIKIDGNVTLSGTPTLADGALNIGGTGPQKFTLTSGTAMTIGGDIIATQNDYGRTAIFIATNNDINVTGNVTAAGLGRLKFGGDTDISPIITNLTDISGTVTATKNSANGTGGIVEFYSPTTSVGSMSGNGFVAHGEKISATSGNIDINGSVWFDGTTVANGLVVQDTKNLKLTTKGGNGDVIVRNDVLATSPSATDINTLTLESDTDVTIGGGIKATDYGHVNLTAARNLTAKDMQINSGAVVNIDAPNATFRTVNVTGDMYQDSTLSQGALNIVQSGNFTADSLSLTGNFIANNGQNRYTFNNSVSFGDLTVNGGGVIMTAQNGTIRANNVTNHGNLELTGNGGINVPNGTIESDGNLVMNSGTGYISVGTTDLINGTTTVSGRGLLISSTNSFEQNMLRQNYYGTLNAGDINVIADNYIISANGGMKLGGIKQESGSMTLSTSSLAVNGDITATDLNIAAIPAQGWLNAGITGNVSGNTKFVDLQRMEIGGNYTYNSNSGLTVAILSRDERPYWAKISVANDGTLGQITNLSGDNAEPLISVNGAFITQLDDNLDAETGMLSGGKLNVKIFDMIDQGTAIWLLQARLGIVEEDTKIRNLSVLFCNADGTECFAYLKPTPEINETGENLPGYISVRDSNNTGFADSLYLVFDPRFGGPVEIFKIQPIVGREPGHTDGEYVTAGALDDMIAGRLETLKFYNRTPIEAVPFIFRNTNMAEMANELYARMEYYDQTHNGGPLTRFSRLFQPREMEQLAASIALNEHTTFRDFEDHMLDEFIWNRNRNLRKAWGEFGFGMFSQREADGLHADGNRFSFIGGYDWQETDTLILGLAGHVSHMSGNGKDDIDLTYKPGQPIFGGTNIDVTDTNIGIGAYLLQNINQQMRAYGNAFFDVHLLDVSRDQTYMAQIKGNDTAFSLISEWGLMHDWLNQYIVGNVYGRVGYSSGFSIKETAGGSDYMDMKYDGYFIFTPGYSLIAQKRIYPSSWFQIRPYASIGVEYDVLGTPDNAKFKFMAAKDYTKYDIKIDPLWANIGGGVELLSATGIQVGLDYRYQYNADIQLHNIKLSGSYRF